MNRVCMVAYSDYRTDTRVRREAEALVARGDSVTVISLAPAGETSLADLNGVRLVQVRVRRYRGSGALTYLVNYLVFFLLASLRLAVLHLRESFHIVQVHTLPDFMVFTALVPKLLGAKVILDVHDLMPELYRSKFGLDEYHPLVRLIAWTERASIAFADRAIAVHEVHLKALVRHGNPAGKFTVLMNLPDPALFTRENPRVHRESAGLKLIYHGTVSHRHGLQVLLQAMAILGPDIEGLELHIIGDGDGIPNLVSLVEALNLSGKVLIHRGFHPPEEIVPLIRGADVGVVPTLVDAFTRYMLPVKLLEYVALGLPVICARTETLETYFDDDMVAYFRSGDSQDLSEVIRALHRNPGRLAEIVANAEKFNREYGWEQHKSIYYRLVDELSSPGSIQRGRRAPVGEGGRANG
jgi:glycosyltransferase involved in cell wall biosynthesis